MSEDEIMNLLQAVLDFGGYLYVFLLGMVAGGLLIGLVSRLSDANYRNPVPEKAGDGRK